MKRFVALVLAALLLLNAFPLLSLAEEAAALPKVGDRVEGFRVVETRE